MKKNRTILNLLAGMALLLAAGCDEEEYQLKFSHHLHVTGNEMGCDECHGEPGAEFNVISHETCTDCHDEPEAEEIGPETCGYCHQEKQVELYQAAAQLTEEMTADSAEAEEQAAASASLFLHTEALAGKCTDCHNYLLDEELVHVPELTRSEIVAIRNKAHMSGDACTACHIGMDRDTQPVSHDQAWMKRHGMHGVLDEASCSVCHSEDSCTECHSVMQPASHNNLFRLQTHGALARWNRDGCQVCHEEDSCRSCHEESRPRSHNARWEENHCYGCHIAAPQGEGCVVCHEEGNSVLTHQRFWPPVHDRFGDLANCFTCHDPYED